MQRYFEHRAGGDKTERDKAEREERAATMVGSVGAIVCKSENKGESVREKA
jgi:hypothetical protein